MTAHHFTNRVLISVREDDRPHAGDAPVGAAGCDLATLHSLATDAARDLCAREGLHEDRARVRVWYLPGSRLGFVRTAIPSAEPAGVFELAPAADG